MVAARIANLKKSDNQHLHIEHPVSQTDAANMSRRASRRLPHRSPAASG
jgi:hypothetical protein